MMKARQQSVHGQGAPFGILWGPEEETINAELRQGDEVALFCAFRRGDLHDSMSDLLHHDRLPAECCFLRKVTIENNLVLRVCEAESGNRRVVRDLFGNEI